MSDLDRLRELEESLWRSKTRYDAAHLDRVLHPAFFEFGQSGRSWTRANLATEGDPIAVELPLPAYHAELIAPDVALVRYESRQLDGSGAANRSSVWIRTPDGWRLRFHQGTPRSA